MSRAIRQHLALKRRRLRSRSFCFAMGGTAYATHPRRRQHDQHRATSRTARSKTPIWDRVRSPADRVANSTLTGSDVATSGLLGSDIATDTLTSVGHRRERGRHAASMRPRIPAARVTNTSGQVIPNGTLGVLAFNSERYDTASMHSNSSNTSRLTAPGDGHLRGERRRPVVGGPVHGGASTVQLRKNGSVLLAWEEDAGNDANTVSTMARLVAGDYIEVLVSQLSGSSKTIGSIPSTAPSSR